MAKADKIKRFQDVCPQHWATISRGDSVSNIPVDMLPIYTRQGWSEVAPLVKKEEPPQGVEPAKTKGRGRTKKTSTK